MSEFSADVQTPVWMQQLIACKRDGGVHSQAEIQAIVQHYTQGDIPDYQMAAWLMAAYWHPLTTDETFWLTEAMAYSGAVLDLSMLPRTADKHSTGGVGDTTSLLVAPMLAALGMTVAKMSGRGLAHTGGTIDKLESIRGWSPNMSAEAFIAQASRLGLVLSGQSATLTPADGLIYALRDATATVNSIPLIASSIMSKKWAAGAHIIVLDVKVGRGAFMKTLDQARELARLMIQIGQRAGRVVRVVLSDMNQPLGQMIGNALEVQEAVDILRGAAQHSTSSQRLITVACVLVAEALQAEGVAEDIAWQQAQDVLASGAAWRCFREFIAAQGGDLEVLDHSGGLAISPYTTEVLATQTGYIAAIDALALGEAVLALGGGRHKKGEDIDYGVGLQLMKTVGEAVSIGEPWLRVHYAYQDAHQHAHPDANTSTFTQADGTSQAKGLVTALELAQEAIQYSLVPVLATPLILGRMSSADIDTNM